jgi:uncharacterized protein (TIGR02996 family)
VAGTEAIFRELLASLSEEERQAIPTGASPGWYHPRPDPTDPWQRFVDTFGFWIWWGERQELYARLLPRFAAWLEEQGDERGELVRLHLDLADRGWGREGPAQDMELAFLRDILARPLDEGTFPVFADWLEERDDPRAYDVRLLGRRRALGRSIDAWWVEDFFFPRPEPGLNGYSTFSDATRRLMQFSNQEAQRLNHVLLSTQHVLLALFRGGSDDTRTFVDVLGLHRHQVALELERVTPVGTEPFVLMGKLPQSARLRATVCFAAREAEAFGDETVRPEHILLGLCRAAPCVATRIMVNLGVAPALVCELVLHRMGHDPWPWLQAHPEVW